MAASNSENPHDAADPGQSQVSDPRILVELIELLQRLPQDARARTVDAAMRFLGAEMPRLASQSHDVAAAASARDEGQTPWPRRAQIWLAQHKIDGDVLLSVFHSSSSGVDLIAHELPASSNKERVRQCYLLAGVRGLLQTGEARFSDEEARNLCRDLGCYDKTNHATYTKAIGNWMTGSKNTGLELTQPGLREAAELIRSMARS